MQSNIQNIQSIGTKIEFQVVITPKNKPHIHCLCHSLSLCALDANGTVELIIIIDRDGKLRQWAQI